MQVEIVLQNCITSLLHNIIFLSRRFKWDSVVNESTLGDQELCLARQNLTTKNIDQRHLPIYNIVKAR